MIQVTIDSIRVSLTRTERAILLKEMNDDRQLPIFIHPNEAEAILTELQGIPRPRPMTHDLLRNCIAELGGELQYVVVNEQRDGIFFALLHVRQGGVELDIDARPSDSVALAVRAKVPIFVQESVMEQDGIYPAQEQELDEAQLSVFKDFVESLNIDDLETD